MNFSEKKLLLKYNIKKMFPYKSIKKCYAYGSAVIPQKDNLGKMIDLFFIVDDLEKFHSENMKLNENHYSNTSKFFGISQILNTNKLGTCVYYNPNIKLDESLLIKYGVISSFDFKFKLKNWDNLFVAGRFHKPVRNIELDNEESVSREEIDEIILQNRRSAFSLCALKNKREVDIVEFFIDLANLSYVGDIRTYLKAEKKDKIKNAVLGALESYLELYKPMLEEFNVVREGNKLIFDEKFYERHYENIPKLFMTNLQIYNKYFNNRDDFEQFLLRQISVDQRRIIIDNYLKNLNFRYSVYGVLSGMFTTNTSDSIGYMLEKYTKAILK